jgi:hypothetical protein
MSGLPGSNQMPGMYFQPRIYPAGTGRFSGSVVSTFTPDCAKHGADSGFTCYCDTLAFFRRNRQDIIKNLEYMAGEDIIGWYSV